MEFNKGQEEESYWIDYLSMRDILFLDLGRKDSIPDSCIILCGPMKHCIELSCDSEIRQLNYPTMPRLCRPQCLYLSRSFSYVLSLLFNERGEGLYINACNMYSFIFLKKHLLSSVYEMH